LFVACGGAPAEAPRAPAPTPAPHEAAPPADTDSARLTELAKLVGSGDVAADNDKDGIADALEEDLLRRYRPYYRFSKDKGADEDRRPADPVEELRHATLEKMRADGEGAEPVENPRVKCGRLDPPSALFTCRPDASLASARAKSAFALRLDAARHGGVSFDEARAKATGLYGHVTSDVVDGAPAYKIEYWQFFAFNNQDITVAGFGSFGDHEGDWTSVQLWFDRTAGRLAKILYLVHGKSIHFEIPSGPAPACKGCMIEVKGKHHDPNVGNFFDEAARKKYDDNQAEFFVDGQGYRHVVVYLERGAHEFWPGAWGHAEIDAGPIHVRLDPHNGQGTQYLVPDEMDRPLNLGEVDAPFGGDAAVVLLYNGFWGSTNAREIAGPVRKSPPGPALHCSWKWPTQAHATGCEN
jgi:hypothetical protein